ncbi:terminase [Nocardiopsis alba]|uniref:terminase n=1 Tax=Nocardiopsis alba TaxID=53437 RepID=UPI003818BA97
MGKTIVQFRDGRPGKIEPVTASSESLEGGRPTFAIFEEPHHWTDSTGGHKVARTVRRNLGKIAGGQARAVEVTNAHDPNRKSVAQGSYENFLASKEDGEAADYLYDCREAPPGVDVGDEDALREALKIAYGDSTWVDFDRILSEIYDRRNPIEESRRFYLNQVVASIHAWVRPDQVDAIVKPGVIIPDGAQIALGFDGSKSADATALIATDIESGHVWSLGIWERPDMPGYDRWTVPTDHVEDAVRAAFETWDVVAFFADVAYWQGHVDRWAEEYRDTLAVRAAPGHSVAFDMRARTKDFVRAAEATHAAIEMKSFTIADDPALIRHLKNARRRVSAHGVGIGKETRESPLKVDGAVTLVIAREARRVAIERGRLENRTRPGSAVVYGF